MDNNNQNTTEAHPRHKWRLPALIMALAVCVASAFAIGRVAWDEPEVTGTITEDAIETLDNATVPEDTVAVFPGSVADYDGATFKILITETERHTDFDGNSSPTIISRAEADEGQMLAFDLNIKIKTVRLQNPVAYVMAAHAANEGDTADLLVLDLYVETSSELNYDTTDLLAGGLLADLNKLENVELDGVGYYKDVNDALSVCSGTYLAASSATVGFRDSLTGVIVDKGRLDDSYSSLAELVRNGKWTLDAMHSFVKELGDDALYTDCDDALTWMLGMGARDAVPTDDGFRVSVNDGNAVELFRKLKSAFYDGVSANGTVGSADAAFRQGTVGEFATLDTSLYGLVPLPKASEDAEYISVSDTVKATVMAITSFCVDPERSGVVMDLLVKRSAEHFDGEYVKGVARDDELSRDSLEKMLARRSVCVIAVLGYPDALEDACETLILEKNADVSAFLKQRSYFLQNALDIIVSDIVKDAEN